MKYFHAQLRKIISLFLTPIMLIKVYEHPHKSGKNTLKFYVRELHNSQVLSDCCHGTQILIFKLLEE